MLVRETGNAAEFGGQILRLLSHPMWLGQTSCTNLLQPTVSDTGLAS